MGDFDKIIKENIESIFLPLLEKFTGIKVVKSVEVKDKIQRTVEREPDFLKKVTDYEGREFILQMEFQTQDDHQMVYRMAEYKALLQRKYALPVKQLVVYLGTKPSNMRTQLTEEEQITGFELRDILRFELGDLIKSDIPEEIIIGILSNYPKSEANQVVSSIIARLKELSASPAELNGFLRQLIVLSRLRKLENLTKEKVESMPITYDITTDGLYRQGIEQKEFQAISNLLKQGLLTNQQIAEAMSVDLNKVLEVKSKINSKTS